MPRHPSPQAVVALPIPPTWRSDLGAQLRTRRQSVGWSRELLADRSGYSPKHINKIERGEGSLDAIVCACAALGVSPAQIFAAAFGAQ